MSTITHTTTRRGQSWQPSMGSLGEVGGEEITTVRWNDIAETTLVVAGTQATVWHAGKRRDLKWIGGNHEAIVAYWTPRIQKRLESQRLRDRVRNWRTEAVA